MYTPDGLKEFLNRSHQSMQGIMNHCKNLTDEELHTKLDGFGYPTIHLQLHHTLGAQRYWIGVLEGRIDVDDDEDNYNTIEKLEEFRLEVFNIGEKYLNSATNEELSTPRTMMTWGNKERVLIPAQVVMRTLTHMFQHNGQVAAMCRLLGKPIPEGLDYPVI